MHISVETVFRTIQRYRVLLLDIMSILALSKQMLLNKLENATFIHWNLIFLVHCCIIYCTANENLILILPKKRRNAQGQLDSGFRLHFLSSGGVGVGLAVWMGARVWRLVVCFVKKETNLNLNWIHPWLVSSADFLNFVGFSFVMIPLARVDMKQIVWS